MKTHQSRSDESVLGLIAWLDETRVRLPLNAVDFHFDVFGDIADVRIDQVFHQANAVALDVTYTFPLPAGAAVYSCEMVVNGRVIRAVAKEENEARELAAKLKAQGRRVARTEAPRENIFTLELGNVQAGDVILIRLAYFQMLDRAGDLVSLSIPSCPGIRYIPGRPLLRSNCGKGVCDDTGMVPDASKITPPRISGLHPDAARLSVEGTLSAEGADPDSVSSPSHPVIVSREDDRLAVRLSPVDTVPDRDFILRWREQVNATTLRVLSRRWGDATYAAVRVAAPRDFPDGDREPADVYLLVDRSGSMGGIKWEKAVEALDRFANELSPHDRVFLTLFDSGFIDFDEQPVHPGEMLADPSFRTIGEDEGPRGGTELLPALEHVIEKLSRFSAGRRPTIVLITDGQVGNEEQILETMAGAGEATLHCFGIDTTVNDAFLKRLARQHGGGCALMSPDDNIPQAVAALAVRLRKPALLGLAADPGWDPGRTTRDGGPDVHAGEAVTLVFCGPSGAATLRLHARRADGSLAEFEFPIEPGSSDAPRLLWARERISELLAEKRRDEAIALAVGHNLACEGTSFLAWDEAEKVPVARRDLYQPAMEPGDWDVNICHVARFLVTGRDAARLACVRDTGLNESGAVFADGSVPAPPTMPSHAPSRRASRAPAHRRPVAVMEELLSRYGRFGDGGLPFPIQSSETIRGRRRISRLREALAQALRGLPDDAVRVIVGILMNWLVRGSRAGLRDRTARLEDTLRTLSYGDPRHTLAEIAAGLLSGEERQSLERLIPLLDSGKPAPSSL